MSLAEIRRVHPQVVPMPRRARFTDDTQMTLFTAEGLIEARDRNPVPFVHRALLRWLATQGIRPTLDAGRGGLLADRRLHAPRAPGATCLSALHAARAFGCPASNDSKGCGTIMRVAPCAFAAPDERVAALARATSALTHGHPTAAAAAAFWAELLRAVWRGAKPEAAALRLLSSYEGETAAAVRAALDAPRDGRAETTEALGGGWVAEEALAIALHAALSAEGFEQGLRIAATHSGDSDSTAAVAGHLLGLLHPATVLAHPWRARLEGSDLVERMAAGLAAGRVHAPSG